MTIIDKLKPGKLFKFKNSYAYFYIENDITNKIEKSINYDDVVLIDKNDILMFVYTGKYYSTSLSYGKKSFKLPIFYHIKNMKNIFHFSLNDLRNPSIKTAFEEL